MGPRTGESEGEFKLDAYLQARLGSSDVDITHRLRTPDAMKYLHKSSEGARELAVLVGDYPALDDKRAVDDLQKVKTIEPKSLSPVELAKQGRKTYQQLIGFRMQQRAVDDKSLQSQIAGWTGAHIYRAANPGPMGSAFLTRNPLQPKDQRMVGVVDAFVYEMNKHVPHSLLNCPGEFTLQVATFSGGVIIEPKKIRELQQGKRQMESRLVEAAELSHKLTEASGSKVEAYEFHDRG